MDQRTTGIREGLPASWYFDPQQYAAELDAIWARHWLCVGRAEQWPKPGAWRRVTLGDQQVIVTRDRAGELRAFHNTCRHRGSRLCQGDAGRFAAGRIVCPYHAWAWSLDGELIATPMQDEGDGFRHADWPLYPVAVTTRGGFVFIRLSARPGKDLDDALAAEAERLDAWPLESLVVVHSEAHEVACNWKIFWENYSECYHCPGTHPGLSRLVPLYREGLTRPDHLPPGHPLAGQPARLREDAVTWSADGDTPLPWFEGLDDDQRAAGMTFADFLPSMFVIAHVDHVRSVRVWPLAAERTLLTVNWLLPPGVRDSGSLDLERLVGFARQVVMEDARACEINQGGQRSRAHRHGVLLPFEDDVAAFDDWVREQLPPAG